MNEQIDTEYLLQNLLEAWSQSPESVRKLFLQELRKQERPVFDPLI